MDNLQQTAQTESEKSISRTIMSKLQNIDNYTWYLVAISLFHILANLIWHAVNNAPPTWDSAGHLGLAFLFRDRILALFAGEMAIADFIRISNYYPPLVQFTGGVSMLLLGRNFYSALFPVGTTFLVISFIFLYKIVDYLFKDKKLAILTVLIYSFFPHVWEQSRHFHLDVPLVALLLGAFYYLIRSNSLKTRKYAILFFVFFTLAQLTKWYAFTFLVVPFVYEVYLKAKKAKDFDHKDRIENLVIGSAIVFLFAIPWYFLNIENIVTLVSVTGTGEIGDPANVFSVESIFHYLKLMTSHQIAFFSVILVLASMVLTFKNKVPFRKQLLAYVLFPYLIFTFIQNKDLRYILPLTPIFAFYIAYMFLKFDFRFKKVLMYAYACYLALMFFFMSFNQFSYLPSYLKPVAYAIGGPYYHGWFYEPYFYAANTKDWQGDDIIRYVDQLAEDSGFKEKSNYRVLEISDNRYYSIASFELYRRQNEFENMQLVVPYFQLNPLTSDELNEYLQEIEMAVVPSDPGPEGLRNIAVLKQLIEYFTSENNSEFMLVKEFEMPDGNTLSVYKRSNQFTYRNPGIRDDSLKVYMDRVLYLDRSKIGDLNFSVMLYDAEGNENVIVVAGGGGERRIPLEGVKRVVIDLPADQKDIREIRGWLIVEDEYVRDDNYDNIIRESGYEYVYENFSLTPRSEFRGIALFPSTEVKYMAGEQGGNVIKVTLADEVEKAFVAYATEGWVWNNTWLTPENREITIPVDGLLQVEISQHSQLISTFPSDWGFFVCYSGNAICFYPVVEGL